MFICRSAPIRKECFHRKLFKHKNYSQATTIHAKAKGKQKCCSMMIGIVSAYFTTMILGRV